MYAEVEFFGRVEVSTAAMDQGFKLVKLLIDSGADVNYAIPQVGQTAMDRAFIVGDFAIAQAG